MEFFDNILQVAFQPGDLSIFVFASAGIGLATGRFSSLWLAVLFAVGIDAFTPVVLELLDGSSYEWARLEAVGRIAEQGGSGLVMRSVGYFGSITGVLLLKKALAGK
ncbi:hypothetical protein MNBD_ALPHA06-889 [hydrothermal vent metagenome]|uniref:Uncharacterized protein n=1 Tax=hydrothermal vent metagenome TaxID=652676 RepID=A0A3B0RVG5_9ZZZZ